MDGFLNLNKPAGLTSHDCVSRVRKILKMKRVGHGGTLDPAATGVLPIALGKATRLLQYLPQGKAYQAIIRFGVRTTTEDLDGDIVKEIAVPWLEFETVKSVLGEFQGTIQQIPPSYSAIQVQGKRLYELARAGEKVEAPVRTVEVHQIQVLDWRSQDFPELTLAIACGAGTYIRSIARDLGERVGTGATLANLIRTASSGFSLTNSVTLEELAEQAPMGFQPILPAQGLGYLQAIALDAEQARRWGQGQRIPLALPDPLADSIVVRVHQADGQFLGIGQWVSQENQMLLLPKLVWGVA